LELAKLSFANPVNHHQVFDSTKRPVLRAMVNYPFGENLAHTWQLFEFPGRSGVYVYLPTGFKDESRPVGLGFGRRMFGTPDTCRATFDKRSERKDEDNHSC
jgi:hypothetical protein